MREETTMHDAEYIAHMQKEIDNMSDFIIGLSILLYSDKEILIFAEGDLCSEMKEIWDKVIDMKKRLKSAGKERFDKMH